MTSAPCGLLFDCYGTLLKVRDDRNVTRRFITMAAGMDGPSPMTQDAGLDEALIAQGVPAEMASRLGHDARMEAWSADPLPGALETVSLARSAGVPVAIISNLSREYADPIARHFAGVPVVASFAVGCAKPHPMIYDAGLAALGRPAGRIVMIGDSRRCDHDGALAAGIEAILLTRTPRPGAVTMPDMNAVHDWLLKEIEDKA